MREPTENFNNLLQILNYDSKKELEKHARRIVVYHQDLVALILYAQHGSLSSYLYANCFDRKIPEHLIPKKNEQESISSNGVGNFKTNDAKKFTRKIFQMQIEQRSFAAHLFYTNDLRYWHLFYFDNRDKLIYKNHWKQGPHIHFISNLLVDLPLESVWEKVKSGDCNFKNKLHLKYQSN